MQRMWSNICYEEFIDGKKRRSKAMIMKVFETVLNSTASGTARIMNGLINTFYNYYKEQMRQVIPEVRDRAMEMAIESTKLVMGIDDFSIRKGQRYNTGIHDLRNETTLGIVEGRKQEDIKEFIERNPKFKELKPYAVVMDLAKHYHEAIKEIYPKAIRIADR